MMLPEYRQAIERSNALSSALCRLRCGNATAQELSAHILSAYGTGAQSAFDAMAESVVPLPAQQATAASQAFPVGSLFITTAAGDPATQLGYGAWEAYGQGRVLVGLDAGQAEFDATGKTGGAKTHVLTAQEMPSHTHAVSDPGHNHTQNAHSHTIPVGATDDTAAPFDRADAGTNASGANATTQTGTATATNISATTGITLGSAGGGAAHNNLPPYVVVFMWRRTA